MLWVTQAEKKMGMRTRVTSSLVAGEDISVELQFLLFCIICLLLRRCGALAIHIHWAWRRAAETFSEMCVMAGPSLLQRLWYSCDSACIGLSLAGLRLPMLNLQHSTRFLFQWKKKKKTPCLYWLMEGKCGFSDTRFSNIGTAEQRNAVFPSVCWKLAPQELKINLAARLLGRLLLARVMEAGFAFTHGLQWAPGLLPPTPVLHSWRCWAHRVPPVAGADVSFSAGVQLLWGWEGIRIF